MAIATAALTMNPRTCAAAACRAAMSEFACGTAKSRLCRACTTAGFLHSDKWFGMRVYVS